MFCKNCGTALHGNEKFCPNCGTSTAGASTMPPNAVQSPSNPHSPITHDNLNINESSHVATSAQSASPTAVPKKNTTTIVMIFVLIGIFLVILFAAGSLASRVFRTLENATGFIDDAPHSSNGIDIGDLDNSGDDKLSTIQGKYTREEFSDHTFTYATMYDTATFTFNDDSTFTIIYADGNEYRGTYAVYNGLYITAQVAKITEDTHISHGHELADDINDVANRMMDSTSNILNTYLLWLETDTGIIQPFVINYDSASNSGTAVNIMGQTQGSFTRK